jgi:hypothetical protein
VRSFIRIAAPSATFPFTQVISATGNCIEGQYPDGWYWQDDYAAWAHELSRYFQ